MVQFSPLRLNLFYYLNKVISKYGISGIFLDVGGGNGETSLFLRKKGFLGTMIDNDSDAVGRATSFLGASVDIYLRDLNKESGVYDFLILFDVLEHQKDDLVVLSLLKNNLKNGGYLLITIPVFKKKWGWDDELAGHYRRYEIDSFKKDCEKIGYSVCEVIDYTYPFYCTLRNLMLKFGKRPLIKNSREELGRQRIKSFGDNRFIKVLQFQLFWYLPNFIQRFFKHTYRGSECLFVLRSK